MWPDNMWPDNFWPENIWPYSEDIDPSIYNIILIDGSTNFAITTDASTSLPQGAVGGRFTQPVQDSYGGLIRLKHNFPYLAGNTAKIGYEAPDGEFGEIDAYSFDAEYVKAFIPEGLLDTEDKYWKFNIIAEGVRNGRSFRVRSKFLKIKVLDGLINEATY